jgi:zinc protease
VLNMLETVNYNELERSFLDKYVQMVSAVTAQDVSDMAKKYLDTNKMTIVVVGDRSKIDEQLKPYQP